MKYPSFSFLKIFVPVGLGSILLLLPASTGLAAESGLDTAKIESIQNRRENVGAVSHILGAPTSSPYRSRAY
jgi:hypothetical protein